MTRSRRAARRMVIVAALALAACGRGSPPLHRIDPPGTARAASEEVSRLLYEENLIADPEVHARMNDYILAVSRDGVPRDSIMRDFDRWLRVWVSQHPERLDVAASGARPYHLRR